MEILDISFYGSYKSHRERSHCTAQPPTLALSLCSAADFPLISAARQSLTFQLELQTHGRAISSRQGGGRAWCLVPEWVAYVTVAHMLIRTHTPTY